MEQQQESKLVRKSSQIIQKLRSLNLDFNDVFILECFNDNKERELFNHFEIPSLKDFNISTRYQFLKKNEYLVEDPNDTSRIIISVKGIDLLNDLMMPEPISIGSQMTLSMEMVNLSKTDDEKFEEWWKTYPTTPKWETDDNKTFLGSRNLKNLRKPEAKKRYLKLLNQGLDHTELLGSLLYEIKLRKVDSIKKGENQMEYFKGMESYFNTERYLLYIDNYRENPSYISSEQKIKGKKRNVTDI